MTTSPRYPFHSTVPWEPAPELDRVRAEGPIIRVTVEDGTEAWLVTRHADIRRLTADPRFLPWPPGFPRPAPDSPSGGLLFSMHGPDHIRQRRLLLKAFSSARVDALRPHTRTLAEKLITTMTDAGPPADVVRDLAAPLALDVLTELIGIPHADRDGFAAWANDMMAVLGHSDTTRASEASEKLNGFIVELLLTKRKEPGDDLLSALIAAQDDRDGPGLTDEELHALTLALLVAGYPPPINVVAMGVLRLTQHPDQLAALRADPTLITRAVDEMLRHDHTSAADVRRILTEEVEVGGVRLGPGEAVICPTAAANRDPAVFERPERFDITRASCPHLSFAVGPHRCPGASLARMEVEIAVGTLVRALPGLRLAVPVAELPWRPVDGLMQGPWTLPITW